MNPTGDSIRPFVLSRHNDWVQSEFESAVGTLRKLGILLLNGDAPQLSPAWQRIYDEHQALQRAKQDVSKRRISGNESNGHFAIVDQAETDARDC